MTSVAVYEETLHNHVFANRLNEKMIYNHAFAAKELFSAKFARIAPYFKLFKMHYSMCCRIAKKKFHNF